VLCSFRLCLQSLWRQWFNQWL